MQLSQIFEHLTYNTLSGLAVGQSDIGEISPDNYPKLVTHVNAAMLDLYTRFNLRTREITIQLSDGLNMYQLHSDFAESNETSVEVPHIIDGTSVYAFNDNILCVDEVYNELGQLVPLNDAHNKYSVFTPSVTVLQVPYPDRENMLSLIYRALPDIISTDILDPSLVQVDLPLHFMEAITSFIAWKIYTPIDGMENPKGMVHQGNYLNAAQLLHTTGAAIEDNFSNMRFGDNGWL